MNQIWDYRGKPAVNLGLVMKLRIVGCCCCWVYCLEHCVSEASKAWLWNGRGPKQPEK